MGEIVQSYSCTRCLVNYFAIQVSTRIQSYIENRDSFSIMWQCHHYCDSVSIIVAVPTSEWSIEQNTLVNVIKVAYTEPNNAN